MPDPATLGEALRIWRGRRNFPLPSDLASCLLTQGFAQAFTQNAPDAAKLTIIISDLEQNGDWPWLDLVEHRAVSQQFTRCCRQCLLLSDYEAQELLTLIGLCIVENMRRSVRI